MYQTAAGLTFWAILLLVATVVLGRRMSPKAAIPAFAVFAFALLAFEGETLLYNVLLQPDATPKAVDKREHSSVNPSRPLPNIYHLIFDGYQTDLLEHTLSPESEEALGGFVYFPKNTAVWPYTPVSLATIFSGRRYSTTDGAKTTSGLRSIPVPHLSTGSSCRDTRRWPTSPTRGRGGRLFSIAWCIMEPPPGPSSLL